MATFRIQYYVVKQLARGGFGHYFEPSPSLKAKGWKPVNFGPSPLREDPDKQELAKAKAAAVDAWKNGGASPREVKRLVQRHSFADLIALYKADAAFTALRPNSQRTNRSRLNYIEAWGTDPKAKGGAGNIALASIDADRVARLRDAMMLPDARGVVHHHRAHGVLSMLRTLLAFAEKKKLIPKGSNPAEHFELAAPDPRHQIWEPEDSAAFAVAAAAIGYPDLAFAAELAEYIGQREADMLKLTGLPKPSQLTNWREIRNLDPADRQLLAGADGRVMGLCVRQEKTGRWVGPPISGPLRERIEARIAENAKRPIATAHLLIDDATGRPWKVRQFIRKFNQARAWAIDPPAEARARGIAPRPELAGLQFRDFRRTCVVRLGELNQEDGIISAITGHRLETTKRILETYMPRTTKMAARGIVARIEAAQAKALPAPADVKQEQAG